MGDVGRGGARSSLPLARVGGLSPAERCLFATRAGPAMEGRPAFRCPGARTRPAREVARVASLAVDGRVPGPGGCMFSRTSTQPHGASFRGSGRPRRPRGLRSAEDGDGPVVASVPVGMRGRQRPAKQGHGALPCRPQVAWAAVRMPPPRGSRYPSTWPRGAPLMTGRARSTPGRSDGETDPIGFLPGRVARPRLALRPFS
jgi:hypothetical protein